MRDCPYAPDLACRIVACVNACAGVPTATLEESAKLHAAVGHEWDSIAAQRDELRALAKDVAAHFADTDAPLGARARALLATTADNTP